MEEKILEFEKIFKDNVFYMHEMTMLYNMWCNENYAELNMEQKIKLLDFAYQVYLDDEINYDIGKFADVIMDNYHDVLDGRITRKNIYEYI